MAEWKPTQAFAATFVDELSRCGLAAVCIAPGSRSAPLAMAFARHPGIRVWMHLDERSASFFALGMAKTAERAVAVLCTSGTAAAELHAAVIEAHHSRAPLLVLTADRPPELREVGANQAIDQARLYGGAVRWAFDPGVPDAEPQAPERWRRLAARALAEAAGPPAGPVHLNLPLREPLTPEPGHAPEPVPPCGPPTRVRAGGPRPPDEALAAELAARLARARRPVVVAGEMRDGARLRRPLDDLLRLVDAPLLAEPTSQLRTSGGVGVVESYDALLRDAAWADAHRPDLVLRLGAPPTSKALTQLVAGSGGPLVVVDADGWRDPDQVAQEFVRCDPAELLPAVAARLPAAGPMPWRREWSAAAAAAAAALDRCLGRPPLHEGPVVRALAAALPEDAHVLVGSSMPIRAADTFWPAARPGQRFLANRGASGIDGLVSTGLGMAAASGGPAVLLIGDLTLYHDMNGLWAIRRHGLRAVIVVLDNDGGGIFGFLPQAAHPDVFEELFGTPLGLRLEDVARLYDLGFVRVDAVEDLPAALSAALAGERSVMVSVRFDRQASVAGHRACWAAVAEALRG